jgi:hypothetical protein
MRLFLASLVLIAACTGCHTGIKSWLLGQKPAYYGKPDPDYALATLDGRSRSLAAYRGKSSSGTRRKPRRTASRSSPSTWGSRARPSPRS